jgi:methylated-DNA-[protein]-cysteine S-methyltransferase
MNYAIYESPIGQLQLVADEEGLRYIDFDGHHHDPSSWYRSERALRSYIDALDAYFGGKLHQFDVPLAPQGTAFQQLVWRTLLEIPYGETWSYGELAKRIGKPNAARAVGLANGSNPIPIMIPCHRVIGSNGKLTGYGGGLSIKEKLLALEVASKPFELVG